MADIVLDPTEVKVVDNGDGTHSRTTVFASEDLKNVKFNYEDDDEKEEEDDDDVTIDEATVEEFRRLFKDLKAEFEQRAKDKAEERRKKAKMTVDDAANALTKEKLEDVSIITMMDHVKAGIRFLDKSLQNYQVKLYIIVYLYVH